MTLIDLKRKVRELGSFIHYQRAEIEEARNTVKATQFDKINVDGSIKKSDLSDVIAKIDLMERDLDKATKQFDLLIPLINELEDGYRELNDRDKLIYLQFHCRGYSAVKIGQLHGISDKQVYKILKKVEKNIQEEKKCE